MSIKAVLLGNSGVGKSSIVTRLTIDKFNIGNVATIGGQFVSINVGEKKVNLWDTAGQERFRNLIPLYIRNAQIIIIVIDAEVLAKNLVNEEIEYWYNYANSQQLANYKEFILVINKSDTIENLVIPKQYLTDTRFYHTILISCFNGYNIPLLRMAIKECTDRLSTMTNNSLNLNNTKSNYNLFNLCNIL